MPDYTTTELPVKNAGLSIPDPTLTEEGNWTASYRVTRHLVSALHIHFDFLYGDHTELPNNGRAEIHRQNVLEEEEYFSTAAGRLSPMYSETELGAYKWRDSILLQYDIENPDLTYHCDGCGVGFIIRHALN